MISFQPVQLPQNEAPAAPWRQVKRTQRPAGVKQPVAPKQSEPQLAAQVLAAQVWPPAQTLPQLPQLFALFVVLTSQPSIFLLLLQSPKPALQAPVHTLAVQVGEAMLLLEQTAPQPPQLFALVAVLISQPLAKLLSQSAKLGEHAHVLPPGVLVQAMLAPQPPLLTRHSLTSVQVKPSPV